MGNSNRWYLKALQQLACKLLYEMNKAESTSWLEQIVTLLLSRKITKIYLSLIE